MQEVLKFLTALGKNNNKEWFDKNKTTYTASKEYFREQVTQLIKTCEKFDPLLSGLEASKCMFRINRDVRFSKNKDPYKTNFGASINPGGKNSMIPGYYLHVEPGKSFLASGCYMPMPDYLNAIRQEIEYHPDEFKKIIKAKDFVNYFKELSKEDALKTTPKGFDKDHPQIELLRLKHFIVVHDLKDKELLSKTFVADIAKIFKASLPLNQFLRRVKD